MKQPEAISIENLSYRYDRDMVLKDINLNIEQGFISIIGPNGSGKTTLLKLLSGLLDIQHGSIHIHGIPIQQLSNLQRARCFTVVQQKEFFPFPFSCIEMAALGRYPHRKKINGLDAEDYQIVIEAMRATDTLHLKEKLITEVSGGEQQRVILACALAQEPKILFLDEAFSAMDINYQAKLVELLRRLVQEKGLTIVSIVHDLNHAYRFSDKVCILKTGEMTGYGSPQAVMTEETISSVFEVNVELIERRCFFIDI